VRTRRHVAADLLRPCQWFPSATYGKLFAALAPDYQVQHLAQHAHDPRFPVDDNWQSLVDELLHHLAQQDQPVWGVGHSLGGVLHLHAALRCPEYYRGVVMLDSPVLTRADQWLLRTAKRLGFIDRITPAGRTLGRREAFKDRDSARTISPASHCSAISIPTASTLM
jgi:pimeloyl-ACP methyl ester carboxylesterase